MTSSRHRDRQIRQGQGRTLRLFHGALLIHGQRCEAFRSV